MVFNATVNHRVSQIISQLSFLPPRHHSRCEHGIVIVCNIFIGIFNSFKRVRPRAGNNVVPSVSNRFRRSNDPVHVTNSKSFNSIGDAARQAVAKNNSRVAEVYARADIPDNTHERGRRAAPPLDKNDGHRRLNCYL